MARINILVWYRTRMQLANRNGFCLASDRIYCSIFRGGIRVLSCVPWLVYSKSWR